MSQKRARSRRWPAGAVGACGALAVVAVAAIVIGLSQAPHARTGPTLPSADIPASSKPPDQARTGPLPPYAFRNVDPGYVARTDQVGPALDAIADAACAAYEDRLLDGAPAEAALELAGGSTGQMRRVLVERHSLRGVVAFAEPSLEAYIASTYAAAPKPCTAWVMLWALRQWPEAADPSFLRAMAADPPGDIQLLAAEAVDAMAETGMAGFVEDLEPLMRGERGTRLEWHALRAQARLVGGGQDVADRLLDETAFFDEELAQALPHVLHAVPAGPRVDLVARMVEADDPLRRRAAIAAALDPEIAPSLAPALLERARSSDSIDGLEARALLRSLRAGHADPAHLAALARAKSAGVHVRLAAVLHLPDSDVRGALEALTLEGLEDGTLLLDALARLPRADAAATEALLRRFAEDPATARALATSPTCAACAGEDVVQCCLRSLSNQT